MKVITTKLKRYKIVWWITTFPFIPILLIFGLLWKIGEFAEGIANLIAGFRTDIVYKIADILKFEEEAKKQYGVNPDKFQIYSTKKAKYEDSFK